MKRGSRVFDPIPSGKGLGTLIRNEGRKALVQFDIDGSLVLVPKRHLSVLEEDLEEDSFGLLPTDYLRVVLKARWIFGPEIGFGYHRIVFRDGAEVVKVPFQLSGIDANYEEANTKGPEFARCRIDKALDSILGTPFEGGILRMEYVEHVGWSKDPDWTWSVDCGQVGMTADGRLVAYDWDTMK